MGTNFSALFGGAAAAEEHESSGDQPAVNAFHLANRWQLHYNSIKSTNQLLVVDFSATWCGPCRAIEPVYRAMAERFTDVSFAKIDVDELPVNPKLKWTNMAKQGGWKTSRTRGSLTILYDREVCDSIWKT